LLIMGYMGEENPSLSNKYTIRLAGVLSCLVCCLIVHAIPTYPAIRTSPIPETTLLTP